MTLPSRRDAFAGVVAFSVFILGLDLLWAALGGRSGSLAYGLIDEPAHLATCTVALLLLIAAGRRPARTFLLAALVASVAIDFDHLPNYLGWGVLTVGTPRPYTHSALAVAVVLAAALATRGRRRTILLGVAFGFCAHLLRDVATGPGIPLGLPLWTSPVKLPYAIYAGLLTSAAIVAAISLLSGPRLASTTPRIRTSRVAGVVAVVLTLGAGTGLAVQAQARGHSPPRVAMGIYVSGADRNPSLLNEYINAAGRQPAVVSVYRDWSELPFESGPLDSIAAREAIPLVTWEPWDQWGQGVSLWEIAAGARDGYIAEAARQAAAWGGPLFVRFAHEMNGGWYPWGRNLPAAYKAAWRQVVEIFRREGAANVRWVWTPYVDSGHLHFRRFYPGDKWVDWVGLDGFNWGKPFMSFAKIFEDSYKTMVRMTSKPLIIGETGSVEAGGYKATWIRHALFRALPRFKHVRALVWWSDIHPDGADWRIDTSPSALSALGSALRAPRFQVGERLLLVTPQWGRER